MATWLDELKVGDPVLIRWNGYYSRTEAHRVTRSEKNWVAVGERSFKRSNGSERGAGKGEILLFDKTMWEGICKDQEDKRVIAEAKHRMRSATPDQARAILAILEAKDE